MNKNSLTVQSGRFQYHQSSPIYCSNNKNKGKEAEKSKKYLNAILIAKQRRYQNRNRNAADAEF